MSKLTGKTSYKCNSILLFKTHLYDASTLISVCLYDKEAALYNLYTEFKNFSCSPPSNIYKLLTTLNLSDRIRSAYFIGNVMESNVMLYIYNW